MFTSYSQNFEDVMLWRALKNVKKGFYVDVGAQDPVVDSVSLAFYEQGWRGVHIEPVPTYANLLRVRRPDEIVIQTLIGSAKGVMPFFELPETGLSTTNRETANRHANAGFVVQETLIPCVTLTEALAPFAKREIHWLKIDVEGSEHQVLEGWGSGIKPWVVVVESTVPLSQVESHQTWEPVMLGLGYKFAYFDGLNRFFVSSEHIELLEAFRYGPSYFDGFVLGASTPFCTNLNAQIEELRLHGRVIQEELERRELKLNEKSRALDEYETTLQQLRQHDQMREVELEEGKFQAGEALRSLEESESKVTASLRRIEVLEGDVIHLRTHNNALHESVAIARQHAVGFESRLVDANERIRVLRHNLSEVENRSDTRAQELMDGRERYSQLESERNAAKAEIEELQRQREHWWSLAERWHRDLQALYSSRSWRLTAPLRRTKAFVRAAPRMILREVATLTGLPTRLLRRTLLAGIAYVERRPNRKALVTRLLDRLPGLHDRLTAFAWAHRNRAVTIPSAGDKNSVVLMHPGNDDVRWEIYSSSVRDTYGQLMEARARFSAEAATDR